jgi:alpha-tubulin suppressor-like RCC1 family protein
VPSTIPQPLALDDVVQIAAGISYACARTSTGAVYCWGYNGDGGLGDGTTISRDVPTRVAIGPASEIAVGDKHTCAVVEGAVWCWGDGSSGQVDGTIGDHPTPTRVTLPVRATRVSAGAVGTCIIGEDRQAYCWGAWRVGDGGPAPTRLETPQPVTHIALWFQAYVVIEDGSVLAWGTGGTDAREPYPPPPFRVVEVVGVNDLVAASGYIGADGLVACARETDESLWCWTQNPGDVHRLRP